MTKHYLTVVFEYDDGAKYPSTLTSAFAAGGLFEDVKITALSLEDEISRVEQLEDELMQN